MKKLLLMSLVLCVAVMGYSQKSNLDYYKSVKIENSGINTATDDATNFNNPVSMIKGNTMLDPTETTIGSTQYDLFSNYNVGDRFWVFEDGTMAGVFIFGTEASSFPERGTGYNYYDGTAWGAPPTARVETVRTGWPNISAWGTGGEIGIAHNGSTSLEIIRRGTKGTGDWTQINTLGPEGLEDALTWPRLVGSGVDNEYTHFISGSGELWEGQDPTIIYSRTNDGGDSFDPHNVVLDGYGADNYFAVVQDQYYLTSNGPTVCLLYCSLQTDLFYLRSDDNGDNWETTVVWEFPIPLYDPAGGETLDTTFAPDGSAHMTIDNNGIAHVVFGLTRIMNDDGTGISFFPYHPDWEGIVYWNDEMDMLNGDIHSLAPPKAGYEDTELVDDYNYIGWLQDVDGDGVVTMDGILYIRTYGQETTPQVHVDEFGQRFVIWSANTETFVYTAGAEPLNYKHIWGRAHANGVWGEFKDLTASISHVFDDCVYPMIGNRSDAMNVHYIYQADLAPGNALDGDHDYQENRWIHAMLPKSDLITSIGDQEVIVDAQVSQNFPNPFSGSTKVNVTLETASNLSLVVTNMTGQKVLEINKGFAPAQSHVFTIDASQLQSGVYFYTVTAGASQVTRKMIVE